MLLIGYSISTIVLLFGFTDLFMPALKPISIFKNYAVPGPLYVVHTIHFFFFFVYSESVLYFELKRSADASKVNQIKYIMVATIIGFTTGGLAFLPVYGIAINTGSTHFIWLYTALISYAIVKHKLMDIQIIFRKGLIYALLIGLITTIYFILVFVLSVMFQNYLGHRSVIAALFIFTIIALCFKPLERRLQDFVDKSIFKRTRKMLETENERLMDEMRKQDRMKGVSTLAAGMAHEIKNPLTSIRTFAQYLPEKYDDPEFRLKFQSIMTDEVDRINNIVQQLLEFSKPQPLTAREVSIHDVLNGTLELLANNLFRSSISVIKNFAATGTVRVDPQQMRQVFLNLFLNSIQAMPQGGRLTIATSQEKTPGGANTLVISVSDTGVGIPKEHLGRIFDPFYTTNANSGTGLGLAIVYGIIQEHGGEITVSSSPGSTTFTIRLPERRPA